MDTINSSVNYSDLFDVGKTNEPMTERKIEHEDNISCEHENKRTRDNDIKIILNSNPERRRGRPKKSIPEKPDSQDNKKLRVVNQDGRTRRPANLTLIDEYRIKLNVLAANRMVPMWKLLNEAIRRFLIEEGVFVE